MLKSIITDQIDNDLEKTLPIIKEEGYEYVELHNVFGKTIEACSDEEVNQIRSLLQKYDMKVSNLASTFFFLCPLYPDDKVSLFNPEFYTIEGNVDEHLRYLKRACEIAKELDCPRIRIFPFRWPDNRKPPFGTKQDQQIIFQNLKRATAIAKKENITLVLENCPYSHLPKGMMTFEMIKEINDEHLRLLYDPANAFRAIKENVPSEYLSYSLLQELEIIYPFIDHIHIKDYHYDERYQKPFIHKALGEGDIDFHSLFDYLKSRGYGKAVSLEPEVSHEEALQCMRSLINDYNI